VELRKKHEGAAQSIYDTSHASDRLHSWIPLLHHSKTKHMVHFERQTRISSKAALTTQPFNKSLKVFRRKGGEKREEHERTEPNF
jgi:hypothetical protein